ncbi:hypothetical protein OAQ99_04160 [Candidatus Kapabacteria bacterium]|nr:hypothetical protein [Candidatus Kapabacteria bacterium]
MILQIRNILILILITISYSADSREAKIVINSSTNKIIPQQQKGAFIELLNDYINGPMGMWSQEFYDRGFDINPILDGISPKWKTLGSPSNENGGYNENGKYCVNLGSGDGVYQEIFNSDNIPLDFYFYGMGKSNGSKIVIKILNVDMSEVLFVSEPFSLEENNWNKYIISSNPITDHIKVNILFECTDGVALIDEVSCMPSNNIKGVRKEYYDLYKQWKPKILRYPGGWFADSPAGHWEYGIGDIDKRKSPNLVGSINQRIDLGTKEIFDFCNLIDMELHLTVNFENGDINEAANWVEYCNSNNQTEFGSLRQSHGFNGPLNVKYWEIGNEQWTDPENYSIHYNDYYYKMKEKDNSIITITNGNHWTWKSFFETLMSNIEDRADIWGWHPQAGIKPNDTQNLRNQYLVMMSLNNGNKTYFDSCQQWIIDYNLEEKMIQGSTEWWSSYGSDRDWLLDTNVRNASLESPIFNVDMQHFYMRQAEKMAIGERTVGIGLINRKLNSKGERVIFGNGAFHGLAMINNHSGYKLMDFVAISDKFNHIVEDYAYQVGVDWVDVVVTEDTDSIYVSVINKDPDQEASVEIDLGNLKNPQFMMRYDLTSDNFLDASTADQPNKLIERKSKIEFTNQVIIPKHSFSIFAFDKGIKNSVQISENVINKYPIPALNNISISVVEKINFVSEIFLLDNLGNKFIPKYKTKDNLIILDLKNIPIGFYVISAKINNFELLDKFIKN